MQRQDCFDQSGDTGGCFGVAKVCFDRAQQQRKISAAIGSQRGFQRAHLDRVAEGCAGAMRFHVRNLFWRHVCALHSRLDHFFLCQLIRNRETAAKAAVIHGRAADHSPDVISIFQGI